MSADPQIDRDWIREFVRLGWDGRPPDPVRREFLIVEREGNCYDVYQTYPTRYVACGLTLDEAIGWAGITLARGPSAVPPFVRTPDGEKAWRKQFRSKKPPLEPWQKQLPERAS